jgi:hypothetical protein
MRASARVDVIGRETITRPFHLVVAQMQLELVEQGRQSGNPPACSLSRAVRIRLAPPAISARRTIRERGFVTKATCLNPAVA